MEHTNTATASSSEERGVSTRLACRQCGRKIISWLALALACAPGISSAQAAPNICGSLQNAYGPFDYRTQKEALQIVEQYHFLPQTEALISGRSKSGSSLGGNIDYTLRASPNHHRALVAMMRLGERYKQPKVPGADHTVACYFDRAVRFAPDDHIVRMLYAGFLNKQGRAPEAERHLELVGSQANENAFTLYNLGNVYLELKNYDRALTYAHKAQALGWPRKDLEDKLRALNKWTDPVPSAPAPVASAASGAASGAASASAPQ